MKPKIGFISSYKKLTEEIENAVKDIGSRIEVIIKEVDPLDKNLVIQEAKKLSEYCDVIITRGGSIVELSSLLEIPLVECRINAIDLLKAIYKARKYSGEAALLITSRQYHDLGSWEQLLSMRITTYSLYSRVQIEDKILEIKKDNINVVIGGVNQTFWARKYGLTGILVESGKESIYQALYQAENIVRVQQEGKKRTAILNALLENVDNGILLFDDFGKIIHYNKKAIKMITEKEDIDNNDKMTLKLREAFKGKDVDVILRSRQPVCDKIYSIKNNLMVINMVPIRIKNEITGRMVTFTEVTKVQKLEEKLRLQLADRGLKAKYTLNDIVGNSEIIKKAKNKCKSFAALCTTVLINGETGVGKELFAQSIHNYSLRKDEPFVPLNCSALPKDLLESELFGYEKGAFTGAHQKGKIGLFELAHKGTIFLDEISSMPLELQVKILRVLQEKEVMRLGGSRLIPIDVRIIASNNSDLKQKIKEGKFREDLFYRLNVLSLRIPPLRKRKEDLEQLFKHFVKKISKDANYYIPSPGRDILKKLHMYDWPGNVRELMNFCERIIAMTLYEKDIDSLIEQLIDELIGNEEPGVKTNNETETVIEEPENEKDRTFKETSREKENRYIKELLTERKMKKNDIAELLGVSRTTLWKRLKEIGL